MAGIIVAAVAAAVVAFGIFLWLRRAQPLPANELLKLNVQLVPGSGFVRAHVRDGSSYNLRNVTVRLFAFGPTGGYGRAPATGGWHITSSVCTFDPVTRPPDGYELVFDRQVRFDAMLSPLDVAEAQAASDFVAGADYWECRIVGASGFK